MACVKGTASSHEKWLWLACDLDCRPLAVMPLSKLAGPQELAEEYGRHRATEFNVGAGAARRQTGMRYEDVAGIDHVKADIEAMMDAVLGRGGYSEMGVKPPRVRRAATWSIWLCEQG